MVLLKIAVKDDKLIKVRDRLMIEDTINGIKCHFEFRSDWTNLKTTVAFARGHVYPATENPQTIPAFLDDNNECVVPPEIISERGEFSIGLIGENDGTRIVTHWLYYKTQLGCYDAITTPNPPTPSEYDRILGALNNKSDINHTHDEYVTNDEMTNVLKDKQDVIAENTYDKYGSAIQAFELAKKYADDNDADTQYGIEYDSVGNKIKLVADTSKTEVDMQNIIEDVLDDLKGAMPVAKLGVITLFADKWIGSNNLYSQVVSIDGATKYSQVNLTPSIEQLAIFYEKDLTFVTENEDGVVTVYVIGQKPTHDYTIQTTMTEVIV